MAALAQPDIVETSIRGVIDSVARPKGVRFRQLRFVTDHSGHAAVYIIYAVSKKIPLTKARIDELGVLSHAVTDAIWNLGIEPIPYVDFQDVR